MERNAEPPLGVGLFWSQVLTAPVLSRFSMARARSKDSGAQFIAPMVPAFHEPQKRFP